MAAVAAHTRALVLRSSPFSESDRLFDLFTREFGLVRAIGKSVREERSKLRYGLEPMSLTEVTLVRGREAWRIRGVLAQESFFRDTDDVGKIRLIGNTISLLGRLLAGQEENRPLFDLVEDAFLGLRELPLPEEELASFECILLLRILSELGYKLPRPSWQRFLTEPLAKDLCASFVPLRKEAVRLINETLTETQL